MPDLKWLADANYTHVDYVDLKPKVFDAKIFDDDTHYSDTDVEKNRGTILLCGLNMGGKRIWATDDFDYDGTSPSETRCLDPCYFAIDVTDPRNPCHLCGEAYTQGSSDKVKVYKVFIPAIHDGECDATDSENYVDAPQDPTHPGKWSRSSTHQAPTQLRFR